MKKKHAQDKENIRNCKNLIDEEKINYKRLQNEFIALKDTNVKPTPSDLQKMSSANAELKLKNNELYNEIERLKERIFEYAAKENELLNSTSEIKMTGLNSPDQKETMKLKEENDNLQNKIQELNEQSENQSNEIQKQLDTVKSLEEQLQKASEYVNIYHQIYNEKTNLTPDKIPILIKLAEETSSLKSINKTLRSSLDALCKFTKRLIDDPQTVQPSLIENVKIMTTKMNEEKNSKGVITEGQKPTQNNEDFNLFENEEIRTDIVNGIEVIRNNIHNLCPDDMDTVLLYDAIFGFNEKINALIDNTILKRENNIYAGLVILVSLLNKYQKYINQINIDLNTIYELIPCKKNSSVTTDIIDYLKKLEKPFKMTRMTLKKFCKCDARADDPEKLEMLLKKVNTLLESLDETRSMVNFNQNIMKLPQCLKDEIFRLRDQMNNMSISQEREKSELRSSFQMQQNQSENSQIQNNNQSIITRYQTLTQRKDELIQKLRKDLDEKDLKLHELENENFTLKSKEAEKEKNDEVYKKQREKLEETMKSRKAQFEEAKEEINNRWKQILDDEIRIETQKVQLERDKIREELDSVKQELSELKIHSKTEAEKNQKIQEKQRSQNQALVDQNTKLARKVMKYRKLYNDHSTAVQAFNQSQLTSINNSKLNDLNSASFDNSIEPQDSPVVSKSLIRTPAFSVENRSIISNDDGV